MSRIAKAPIAIPSGVEVTIAARSVTAKGPAGELSMALLPGVELAHAGDELTVGIIGRGADDKAPPKRSVAMSGTTRALVYNLVRGVSEGFEKRLAIAGVGYRAQAQGAAVELEPRLLASGGLPRAGRGHGGDAKQHRNRRARRLQATGRPSGRGDSPLPPAGAV